MWVSCSMRQQSYQLHHRAAKLFVQSTGSELNTLYPILIIPAYMVDLAPCHSENKRVIGKWDLMVLNRSGSSIFWWIWLWASFIRWSWDWSRQWFKKMVWSRHMGEWGLNDELLSDGERSQKIQRVVKPDLGIDEILPHHTQSKLHSSESRKWWG